MRNARFTGHPVYVLGEKGSKYIVMGITSAQKTNGIENISLSKNPEPHNKEQAYMRPQIVEIEKGAVGEVLKGWSLAKKDKQVVEIIARYGKKV